jgi:hypothetical protein
VAVTGKSSNLTTIVLVVSASSISQIFSLHISYIAFENATNLYSAGLLQFDSGSAASLTSSITIPASPLVFFDGLSGFVLYNQQTVISLDAAFNGQSELKFTLSPNATYLNYQYFVVPDPGNPCFVCESRPLFQQGACVAQCSQGSPVNGQCNSSVCPAGEQWDGTQCTLICTGGRAWNSTAAACECPNSLTWNGNTCVSCPSGQVWNTTLGACACPNPNQFWNGTTCQAAACGVNQVMNPFTFQCDCAP